MKKSLINLIVLTLFFGGTAIAQTVVNIDAKVGFVSVYSGQGVYEDPGHDFWNAVTSTAGGTNLLASDGSTVTTISFTVANIPEDQIGFGGTPVFASELLADYYYVGGTTPATFTIGGLTAGNSYDIYFYSQAGSSESTDRAATFTLDGISKNLTAFTVNSFVEGTNYVVFTITPESSILTGSFVGSLGGNEAELNGLQIVDHGASTVPEPATAAALAGLCGLVWAISRRQRHAAT